MVNSILVYGGSGALVDLRDNEQADFNVIVNPNLNLVERNDFVRHSLQQLALPNLFSAILCVAGGWAGGSAGDGNMVNNVYLMEKQCIWSSVICANISAYFLADQGFLLLTGASAALGPTPGMLCYGMVKAAVHQLTKSLAHDSTLPNGTWVGAILPVTLDTEANRQNMPDADFSSWTPLQYVAIYISMLRAGAAYLPLYISYPDPLIKDILEESELVCIIAKSDYPKNLKMFNIETNITCLYDSIYHREIEKMLSNISIAMTIDLSRNSRAFILLREPFARTILP